MSTYTWEQVSQITGLSMADLDALSGQLDHDGTDVTEDGQVTETGLAVLKAQAETDVTGKRAALARLESYRQARERLRDDVLVAHEAGASQAEIARASGLSRQWVGELLDRMSPRA